MIDRIRKYISDNFLIDKGDSIVVSLSGGPDSTALLHILNELRQELGISIFAFHLNHMLRGCESDADEAFCIKLCDELGIELFAYKEDIAEFSRREKISIEAAGRERRYGILRMICLQNGISKIAVAHNLNDNAESILMNIIRGTGLAGLCGIQAKRGAVIRPLLCVRKSEILQYLKEKNSAYVTDSTNSETEYPRNYIRHEIIPRIEDKFNADLAGNITRMAGILNKDNEYLDDIAGKLYLENAKKSEHKILVNKYFLKNNVLSMRKRIVMKAVEDLKGDTKDIEEVHIRNMTDLLDRRSGSRIDLPGGLKAGIEFDNFYIKDMLQASVPEMNEYMTVRYGEEIIFGGKIIRLYVSSLCTIVNNKFKKNDSRIYLDCDKISPKQLVIRHRQEMDMFAPFGRKVTKKLKKYFIEERITVDERAKTVLLASGNEIIWVLGHDFSDRYKINGNTKNVLVCEYAYPEGLL